MSWSSAHDGGNWILLLDDDAFASRVTVAMNARGTLLASALVRAAADVPGR